MKAKCDAKRRASPPVTKLKRPCSPERRKYSFHISALQASSASAFVTRGDVPRVARHLPLAIIFRAFGAVPLPLSYLAALTLYLPTTSTTNEPGLMLRCGLPPGVVAGVSRYSAALRKIFFVLESKAIVRALGCVFTGPSSSYSSADFS